MNLVTDRLKKLVTAGILSREDAARGARARYSLTEAGIQTLPIIVALGDWGLDWRHGTAELRVRQELMRHEDHRVIEELMAELRVGHLGAPPTKRRGPGPLERLSAAYEQATYGPN